MIIGAAIMLIGILVGFGMGRSTRITSYEEE